MPLIPSGVMCVFVTNEACARHCVGTVIRLNFSPPRGESLTMNGTSVEPCGETSSALRTMAGGSWAASSISGPCDSGRRLLERDMPFFAQWYSPSDESESESGSTWSMNIFCTADARVPRREYAVAVMLYVISYCGSVGRCPSTLEFTDGGKLEIKAANFSHSLRLKRNGTCTQLSSSLLKLF